MKICLLKKGTLGKFSKKSFPINPGVVFKPLCSISSVMPTTVLEASEAKALGEIKLAIGKYFYDKPSNAYVKVSIAVSLRKDAALHVAAQSRVLKCLHDLVYSNDYSQHFKVRLRGNIASKTVTHSPASDNSKTKSDEGKTLILATVDTELKLCPIPGDNDDGNMSPENWYAAIIDVDPKLMDSENVEYRFSFQVEVDLGDFVPGLASVLEPCGEVNRKIFDDMKCTDFKLKSAGGREFPCHKNFLMAKSKVLAKSIFDDLQKRENEELVLEDYISDQTIQALLEFIYCNSVTQAVRNSNVAVELMQAADFYNIPSLESAMVKIFEYRKPIWFTVDAALKLFVFIVKRSEKKLEPLRRKMTVVLSVKQGELQESQLFDELFPTTSGKMCFKSILETHQY